ncbi:MAG: hypothetical protein V1492_04875 [Candidatus Micrarchaeota archaeon]
MRLIFVIFCILGLLGTAFAEKGYYEFIPGHGFTCGDNLCQSEYNEHCGICPEDCGCAPGFTCLPGAIEPKADDFGCIPEEYWETPPENPGICGTGFVLIALLGAVFVARD